MDATHAVPPGRSEPDAPGQAARVEPPETAGEPPDSGSGRPPRLHQPMRIAVAVAEIVLAVVLGVAAVWAWRRGTLTYELPSSDNPAVPGAVDRWSGPWIGAAFGFAALAGLLLLDAARQLMLAIGGRWQTSGHDRDDGGGGQAGDGLDEDPEPGEHLEHPEHGEHVEHREHGEHVEHGRHRRTADGGNGPG